VWWEVYALLVLSVTCGTPEMYGRGEAIFVANDSYAIAPFFKLVLFPLRRFRASV